VSDLGEPLDFYSGGVISAEVSCYFVLITTPQTTLNLKIISERSQTPAPDKVALNSGVFRATW